METTGDSALPAPHSSGGRRCQDRHRHGEARRRAGEAERLIETHGRLRELLGDPPDVVIE